MIELPYVNEQSCTGCADCVLICPTQCLVVAEDLPWLRAPADCISCSACALICPTSAIEMAPQA